MTLNSKSMMNPKRLLPLLCALLFTACMATAQTRQVTFSDLRMTASAAMDEINRQTGHNFVFDRSVFEAGKEVEFPRNTMAFTEALTALTAGQNVDYVLRGQVVAITLSTKIKTNDPAPVQSRPNTRTGDAYERNPQGIISAASNPRPEEPEPEPEPLPEPEPVVVPEPVKYSEYNPIDLYGDLQSATPRFAVKSNLLYTAATFTPNLAFEFATGPKQSLEISGSYSWIGRTKAKSDMHKQRVHMVIRPEYRWWLCERYNGHAIGAHLIFAKYNVSGFDIPLMFDKEYRYDGNAYGAGVSYTYNWAFAKRWGLEFNVGLGYMYMKYDKFTCAKCDIAGTSGDKHYFGPTRLGITLSFLLK